MVLLFYLLQYTINKNKAALKIVQKRLVMVRTTKEISLLWAEIIYKNSSTKNTGKICNSKAVVSV